MGAPYDLYAGILAVDIIYCQPNRNYLCSVQWPIGEVLVPGYDFRVLGQLAKVVRSNGGKIGSKYVLDSLVQRGDL